MPIDPDYAFIRKSPYQAINLWHKVTGSLPYYIRMMQQRAAAENAPVDAIYWVTETHKWKCVSELPADHQFVEAYKNWIASRGAI